MGRPTRCLRALVLGLALAIPLVASVAGASADLIRTPTGPAVVPRTQHAAIYDLFGLDPDNRTLISTIRGHLESEGYDVALYRDSTEGAGGHGGGTLANFVKMAKTASVIVINTHGTDFSGRSQACATGKGVARVPNGDPGDVVWICSKRSREAVQQVEWYPTMAALHRAYARYTTVGGFKKAWLYESPGDDWASTLVHFRVGDGTLRARTEDGFRPWLGLTTSGIKHVFGGRKLDLIDNLACHSSAFAASFAASAYLGHASTACTSFESKDEPLLFDRLTGHDGVPHRSVVQAFGLGGFADSNFMLDATQDVVLSPAVVSASPGEGGTLTVGAANQSTLAFDAKMDTANPAGVVTISGCGATISGATWNGQGTALSYVVNVPAEAVGGTATLTVSAKVATAASGDGANADLDGNQMPADNADGGTEPNGDDYVIHVVCHDRTYPVMVAYTGTYQDDFSGGGLAFHEHLAWNESQSYRVSFEDYRYDSEHAAGPAALTASGSVSTTGRLGLPDDSCTIASAAGAVVPMTISTAAAKVSGPTTRYTASFQAQMPIRTSATDPVLAVSGTPENCVLDTRDSIAPYLFFNPVFGGFDPGGTLQAAWQGVIGNVDLDALVTAPLVVPFEVDYIEHDLTGGSDHVVVHATATVSLSGPPTGA